MGNGATRGRTWHERLIRVYLFGTGLKRRMTLGARIALIDGDRVYLLRHTYAPGWHFPGGGIEPGELAEAGAAREVMEESGYRLTARPELFGLYHSTRITNRDHVALYLGRDFEQVKPFKANYEIAEFGWFDRQALPADTADSTRQRVAEIFDGAEKREWW